MSWDCDPLWAKAKLYYQRASNYRHDDELLGLWYSLGLELLARAAVSSVSPTLLAAPDPDHKHLLYALNRSSEKTSPKSIGTSKVLSLCQSLFSDFLQNEFRVSSALINRRNEELHSGTAAFEEYPSKIWLGDFYRISQILSLAMGESLESLLGEEQAKHAKEMLDEISKDLKDRVLKKIGSHKSVFKSKSEEEQKELRATTELEGKALAFKRHHRVICPSCECTAVVQGESVGNNNVELDGEEIIVREAISPRKFSCRGCGLKLDSYPELVVAKLSENYTRTTTFMPEEYYNLVDLGSYDLTDDVIAYIEAHPEHYHDKSMEYDNE